VRGFLKSLFSSAGPQQPLHAGWEKLQQHHHATMHATMVHIETKAVPLYMQLIASDSTDAVVQAYTIKSWRGTK